jgi:hypothetical protein
MSGNRRALPAVVVLAALLAPAGAAHAATTYSVTGADVYVRNKPSGYTIGTLRTGQTVDVQRRAAKGWAFGLVHGEFGSWRGRHCGWVRLSGVFARGAKVRDGCPHKRNVLRESTIFQRGSYLANVGTGAVKPVKVLSCADLRAFGNYDPATGAFATPYGQVATGQGPERPGFGLRYVTKDGRAALLKDSGLAGAPPWFFMPSACIERLPVYIGDDAQRAELGFNLLFGDATREPSLLDAYKDATVVGVRWKRWGSRSPVATGTARVNTCNPICAVGPIRKVHGAKITLSDPRVGDCRGRAFLYTHATINWPKGTGLKRSDQALATRCAGEGKTKYCDQLKLSFTSADVLATRTRCSTAMRVARRAIRHGKHPGYGFSCRRSFNRRSNINSLACRRGNARIDASWGD